VGALGQLGGRSHSEIFHRHQLELVHNGQLSPFGRRTRRRLGCLFVCSAGVCQVAACSLQTVSGQPNSIGAHTGQVRAAVCTAMPCRVQCRVCAVETVLGAHWTRCAMGAWHNWDAQCAKSGPSCLLLVGPLTSSLTLTEICQPMGKSALRCTQFCTLSSQCRAPQANNLANLPSLLFPPLTTPSFPSSHFLKWKPSAHRDSKLSVSWRSLPKLSTGPPPNAWGDLSPSSG